MEKYLDINHYFSFAKNIQKKFKLLKDNKEVDFLDKTNKKIKDMYLFFINELKELKGKNNLDDILNYFSFINFIFNNIEVSEHILDSTDDMNEIFKNLNSKGKPLTSWDIIRNSIYSFSKDDSKDSNVIYLDSLFDKIIDNGYKEWIINSFLKSFYMQQTNKWTSNDKDIFDFFDVQLKNNDDFMKIFLNKINSLEKLFDLKDSENPSREQLQKTKEILLSLNFKQLFNLYLWSIFTFDNFEKVNSNILIFFKKIIKYFYLIVSLNKERANKIETIFKSEAFLKLIIEKKFDFEEIFINNEDSNFETIFKIYSIKKYDLNDLDILNNIKNNLKNFKIDYWFNSSFSNPETSFKIFQDNIKTITNENEKNEYLMRKAKETLKKVLDDLNLKY